MNVDPKLDRALSIVAIALLLLTTGFLVYTSVQIITEDPFPHESPLVETESPWPVIYTDKCPPSLSEDVCEDSP